MGTQPPGVQRSARAGKRPPAAPGIAVQMQPLAGTRRSEHEVLYLDHHATTPLDDRVLEAMLPWLKGCAGNPHSRTHVRGRAAGEAVDAARQQVADVIHAQPEEVAFTSGGTEAANLAIRSFAFKKGDHIVASVIEHSCVRETIESLSAEGVASSPIRVSSDGIVILDELENALTPKTRLVSVMAVNNETGVIQPIDEIGLLCRERGVPFHTDAVQALGKIPIDVRRSYIDLMSLSAHKIYGPQGVGALFCRSNLRPKLRPMITGGGQEQGLRAGTLPTALCVGFGVACKLAQQEMAEDAERLTLLRDRFLGRFLAKIDGVVVNGTLHSRVPGNLNLAIAGIDADALLARLPDVAMSTGSACNSSAIEPSHVLVAMGIAADLIDGSIRIGLGRTTTKADIDWAVERLCEEIATMRNAGLAGRSMADIARKQRKTARVHAAAAAGRGRW
jgi:cysteine desulfurase